MNHLERMDKGLLYISDSTVFEAQKRARRLTQKLNTIDRSDFEGIAAIIKELLGKGRMSLSTRPSIATMATGSRSVRALSSITTVHPGHRRVRIGENAQIAPNVSIYTAGHPVHPATRNTLYEYGVDITIGDNVWIGGNSVICPGVHIGDNCVIGAGSVVTKDIPAWSVATGNPCRVLRQVTEADRETYYRGIHADQDALDHMHRIWEEAGDSTKYPTAP